MILLVCDAIDDGSNGSPNHTNNPQQTISILTNFSLFFNTSANFEQQSFASPVIIVIE